MSKPNPKRWIVFGLALLGMLGTILYAATADAACDPSSYGCADFSERRAFPQDGKCLDFGASKNVPYGDLLNRAGDLEQWDGSENDCTNCPANTSCGCVPDTDIERESSVVYSGSYSAKFSIDGSSNTASFYFDVSFEPDSAYLLSFMTKGTAATDDMYLKVYTGSATDVYYNPDSDTWQAAVDTINVDNMGTDWVKHYAYILTDSVDRTDSRLYVQRAPGTAGQVWYLDDIQIRKLRATGPEFATRERMSYDVAGDPGVECNDAVGCYAVFDGTDDYFERAADGTFSPADHSSSFSVAAKFRPKSTSTASQWISSSGTDWYLHTSSGDDAFLTWKDQTTTFDSVGVSNKLSQDSWNNMVGAYRFDGDTTSDAAMRLNNETEDIVADGEGPLADGGLAFGIGARSDSGSNEANVDLGLLCYWNRALSAVERNQFNNPFFGATNYGDGFTVDTCTQAATHAVCGNNSCVDWNPNSCWPDKQAMPVFGQYTEGVDDNSFEDAPTFAGWTENSNDAGGTGQADVTAYYGDARHGDVSMRMTAIPPSGATVYATMTSPCYVIAPGDTVYAEVAAKRFSGNPNLKIWILEHADGTCTSAGPGSWAYDGTVTNGWKNYGDSYTTTGSAGSVEFQILNYGSGGYQGDVLIDTVSLKIAKYATPWAHCPAGSGTCTYNAHDYRLANPLAQESNGMAHYEDGFCTGGWVWTDWSGATSPGVYFWNVPGTAGNANRWWLYIDGGGNFSFYVYDSATDGKRAALVGSAVNWPAGGWKYIEACSDNTGTIAARHYVADTGVWYSWSDVAGVGTGIQDGAAAELRVGGYGSSSPLDGWIRNIAICPYETPFPKCGWGNGIPQVTPY